MLNVEFKCKFFGKTLVRWLEIDGTEYTYERVLMSDSGEIKCWNDEESFSIFPIYGTDDEDGLIPVIGYSKK